ncbi:MAG: hypothetical protein ACNA8K_15050 [Cyclonatronaceae bacterium]
MKLSFIIVTTLIVAATGVIAGVVFSSGNGSITRKTKLYRDSLIDNFYDFADLVSHPFESLKEETMRLNDKANAKSKKIKAELDQKLN